MGVEVPVAPDLTVPVAPDLTVAEGLAGDAKEAVLLAGTATDPIMAAGRVAGMAAIDRAAIHVLLFGTAPDRQEINTEDPVLRVIIMVRVDLGAALHLEETNMDQARAAAANRARLEGTMEMVQDLLEVVPLETSMGDLLETSMEVEDLPEVDLLVTLDM